MDKAVNEYEDGDVVDVDEVDYGTLTDELCQECRNGYYIKCYANEYQKTWTCNNCGSVESN